MLDLIVVTHPERLGSLSMPRFAGMIVDGMRERGHRAEIWRPVDCLSASSMARGGMRKWLGYADDYLLFPRVLQYGLLRLRKEGRQPMVVCADQALGMLVPSFRDMPHVIHCHDFLAQRSVLGEFGENPTGWSGRIYQKLIRRGYRRGGAFLSISEATQQDLHRFLGSAPEFSEVVYNGLNAHYAPMEREEAWSVFRPHAGEDVRAILHVGGNQWYKNRAGAVAIYQALFERDPNPPVLWMIGPPPSEALKALIAGHDSARHIRFFHDLSGEEMRAAYSLAEVFLFPSLEEGFGWPPLEAMACGTPVLTTEKAPMTEVCGDAAQYIPRQPTGGQADQRDWLDTCVNALTSMLGADDQKREAWKRAGLERAALFSNKKALDGYEAAYQEVFDRWKTSHRP